VDGFRQQIDFKCEARNLVRFADNFQAEVPP
jgi:predicted unusual protein kinase regulating ubiquinone biosynthesis (AarF/ABC1/UbiB family)